MKDDILKGTTTIGLTCSDGVVFAADKRASMGSFIASKKARKTFKVNDLVGATVAGSVGDAEALMRLIQVEASLYEINNKKTMTPKAAANLLANILQSHKYYPYFVQLLIGGINKEKAELYTLDPAGGLIQEDIAATGSGSPVAYGIIDQEHVDGSTVKENIPVAIKALKAAMGRDSATGDGISLVTITSTEFKTYENDEINKILEKLSKK